MQDDERTFLLSWGQALRIYLILCVAIAATQVFPLVRGQPNTAWPVLQAAFVVIGALISLGFRYLCQVRVSHEGLRGAAGRLMKWSEMNEIVQGPWPFGGFVVRSVYVPSVMVSESIARDADFRQRVLGHAPPDHAIRSQLEAAQQP
jgi:hypothetical protein